jgi:phosphoribosylaminoimidazole-succinocarboxamide synthase
MIGSATPGEIIQTDMGTSSVFDVGNISGFVSSELAEARTTHAACSFAWLGKRGYSSHYISREGPASLRVQEGQVQDLPLLSGRAQLDVTGLELLFRIGASEKFCWRVKRGEVLLKDVHLPEGVALAPGVKFTRPYVEASTKWDDVDTYLTAEKASELTGINLSKLEELYDWIGEIGMELDALYVSIGFELVDGKVEVARNPKNGEFVLIDGISLDELGVVKDGEHYGKNLLRHWLKENEPDWVTALKQAQEEYPEDKSMWPPCPPLPEEVMKLHVERYTLIADLLDGMVQTHY